MSDYEIRIITPSDALLCHRIEHRSWLGDGAATLDDFEEWIQQRPENFLVLEKDGDLVGFVHFGHSDDDFITEEGFRDQCNQGPGARYAHIRAVAVDDPGSEVSSIGTLLGRAFDHFESLGKESVRLRCRDQYVDRLKDKGFRYIEAMTSDDISTWHQMGVVKGCFPWVG